MKLAVRIRLAAAFALIYPLAIAVAGLGSDSEGGSTYADEALILLLSPLAIFGFLSLKGVTRRAFWVLLSYFLVLAVCTAFDFDRGFERPAFAAVQGFILDFKAPLIALELFFLVRVRGREAECFKRLLDAVICLGVLHSILMVIDIVDRDDLG
ncbi:hypothetical protein ACPWT1_01060 [Ramlibacter sp. MMS24-I3-19]|uniref:hypothetical protein n=1 Tax=Ramlibacter sp. MMS24-I3-19 TaxID=3416606 RepID=UPI003CFEB600